jgi:hypothetical protein
MTKHSRIYKTLSHFISDEMRMSHIQQPVMLTELLRHSGTASVNDVARAWHCWRKIDGYLERCYATLEKKEIEEALHHCPIDNLAVADLKARKLIIADEIQHNLRLVERFGTLGAH